MKETSTPTPRPPSSKRASARARQAAAPAAGPRTRPATPAAALFSTKARPTAGAALRGTGGGRRWQPRRTTRLRPAPATGRSSRPRRATVRAQAAAEAAAAATSRLAAAIRTAATIRPATRRGAVSRRNGRWATSALPRATAGEQDPCPALAPHLSTLLLRHARAVALATVHSSGSNCLRFFLRVCALAVRAVARRTAAAASPRPSTAPRPHLRLRPPRLPPGTPPPWTSTPGAGCANPRTSPKRPRPRSGKRKSLRFLALARRLEEVAASEVSVWRSNGAAHKGRDNQCTRQRR